MTRARSLTLSVALALSLSGLTLAALEAAFRLKAFRDDARARLDLDAVRAGVPAPGGRARLGHIIRVSPNPRIIYELSPNLDVNFLYVPLTTNADGFRGPALPAPRGERTVRVVGLGDSVMFGWAVRYEDCYLARLGDSLNRAFPQVSWEVLNTAVPGYNTTMEVETLKDKALRFGPDLVIINYVGNDLGLPNFIVEARDYFSPRRSFLLDFVRARLEGGSLPGPRLAGVPADLRRLGLDGGSVERVPARYREMVGLDAYRREMRELAALGRGHAFDVVVLAHPEAQDFVREIGAELGFPVVETDAAVREYGRVHGVALEGDSPLTITAADPHPSPLGHEIIARVLFEHMERSGLARRLIERRSRPTHTPTETTAGGAAPG